MSDEYSAIYGQGVYGKAIYGEVSVFSDPRDCLFSLKTWGKLRKAPAGFVGIYQRQSTKNGQIVRRLKLYSPTNPQTVAQQAHRAKYGEAVGAWRDLTNNDKNVYNERAEGEQFSGYNLFVKEYLKSD